MTRTYPLKEGYATCPGPHCCDKKAWRREARRNLKAEATKKLQDESVIVRGRVGEKKMKKNRGGSSDRPKSA